jgi:peptidoglycan hydrolase FlgJ
MPLTIGTIGMPIQSLTAQSSQAAGGQEGERQASLDKACRDFESLFVNYMLQQMRQTVPQDGMFGGGQAEKLYTSMMDQEVAKEISRQRGIGLAPMMYRQMISGTDDEPTKK